jgi:TPR repeat protein
MPFTFVSLPAITLCCLLAFCPAALAASSAAPTDTATNGTARGKLDEQAREITPEALFASMLINAEKGQPQAMLTVGALYEQGIGVPRNFTRALEWYEKAAFAGDKEGYFRMGNCHEIGMGTVADMAKAIAAFETAAGMGSASARHKMASLYLAGRGVPRDEAKGFTLLVSAAEAGNGAAANELAVVHLKGLLGQKEDPAKAREWFMKSADSGNLEGIKNLAVMLKDGIGQKPDPAGALRWYLIARKGGLQAKDLDSVISELKKPLSAAQVKKAEEDADKWMAAYAERGQK